MRLVDESLKPKLEHQRVLIAADLAVAETVVKPPCSTSLRDGAESLLMPPAAREAIQRQVHDRSGEQGEQLGQ
jgi:hypothetical protein